MKRIQLAVLILAGVGICLSTANAVDFDEMPYDASELAAAVADASVYQAAQLLAAELRSIDRMKITAEEKDERMRIAIAVVFQAHDEDGGTLAEQLGDALGHGSQQLLNQVGELLAGLGFDAAGFQAAAIAAAASDAAVPPPITTDAPPPPPPAPLTPGTPTPTPTPAPEAVPPTPPVAPLYPGQSLL